MNPNMVSKDLLPHISTCQDRGESFIKNQAKGEFWIIPDLVGIAYEVGESDIMLQLKICGIVVTEETISVKNPMCTLEGCFGTLAKCSFAMSLDFLKGTLSATGTACFRSVSPESPWQCVPERTWILLHF